MQPTDLLLFFYFVVKMDSTNSESNKKEAKSKNDDVVEIHSHATTHNRIFPLHFHQVSTRHQLNQHGQRLTTVNFCVTLPVAPSVKSLLPPLERIRTFLEGVGCSIEDSLFLVFDANAVPFILNRNAMSRVPLHLLQNSSSHAWFDVLVPQQYQEQVWVDWFRNIESTVQQWEATGHVGVMVYNPAPVITNGGAQGFCSTQAFLVDPETRSFCGFIHILREEPGQDPRVEELVDELQQQLHL